MKIRKPITPNDINKFVYCNYQWYYEEKYGRKEIRRLYTERNKKLNLKNETYSNFKKGNEFHDKYGMREEKKNVFKYIVIGLIIALFIIMFLAKL